MTITLFTLAAILGAAAMYFAFAYPVRKRAKAVEAMILKVENEARLERNARETLAVEKARMGAVADRVPQLEQEVADVRTRLGRSNERIAELQSTLDSERKNHAARVEELEKLGVEIERKFVVLASEALGKNSENFLKLMSERFEKFKATADTDLEKRAKAIEELIKPITDSLVKFEHKVGEIEKAREGAYQAISQQVKSLAEGQVGLRAETGKLVQALRRPQTRGRWGEYQLRNVLEMAGMTEHVDFVEEQSVESDDKRLRPDVIVRLPGGKSVVVDAKTPLEAYLAAVEAVDSKERERYIAEHAKQVREHVRVLGSRTYWKALPVTPDFVVMFVPGEAIFAAAIETDPSLFEQAVRQRVLISTPTTFIALVKAIAYGWQQEKLAENAQVVVSVARELFERVQVFGEHMIDLGRSLRHAVDRYNKSVGSLEGRVLPTARKFESLGVAPTGSSIPQLEPVEIEPREPQASELVSKRPTKRSRN